MVEDNESKDVTPGEPRSVVAANGFGRDEARLANAMRSDIPGRDRARPSRKTPAHLPVVELSNKASIVFVTSCSQGRRKLFDEPDIHELVVRSWMVADAWLVGRYVIMPDHIHMFCAPANNDYPLLTKWVQYWKSMVSRNWPHRDRQPIWQKSCWDIQLRRNESYSAKWEFVRNNPVRAGLCEYPEEWPFQGELNVLAWHD